MEKKNTHWVEQIAQEIMEKKKEPHSILSGITTSGPTHLGTLCEFLYAHAVSFYLKSQNRKVNFYFTADIMDAFDSVPALFQEYEAKLAPELGKPLAFVPDPLGCHASIGEHFLADAKEVMEELDVHPAILRAQDLYSQGKYDPYALLFIREQEKIRGILQKTSMRELKKTWSPIMPICENCGKIADVIVTEMDVEGNYSYSCSCSHKGGSAIKEHKYKLVWRLDWPARQDFLNCSGEGAGVDHMTKGGSWDSAREIHKAILKKDPPIIFKFGFILLQGKKYSKSKGIGLSVRELLKLVPPEIIKYALFRPDIQENKDFNPTGYELIKLFNDFSEASALLESQSVFSEEKEKTPVEDKDALTRAENKKIMAVQISGKKKWKLDFSEYLLHHQIYGNLGRLSEKDSGGSAYLKKYIDNWVEGGFEPEDYDFKYEPKKELNPSARKFFLSLDENMDALAIHNSIFEFAKESRIDPKDAFKMLYSSILNKEKGPRLGRLIETIGVLKIKKDLGLL